MVFSTIYQFINSLHTSSERLVSVRCFISVTWIPDPVCTAYFIHDQSDSRSYSGCNRTKRESFKKVGPTD